MTDELEIVAEEACAAIRRHATAVIHGTSDRVEAGPALVLALEDMGKR